MTGEAKKPRLNAAQKHERKVGDVALFVQRYGRKRRKQGDPNDRRFSPEDVRAIERLAPGELDRLIRDADD